MSWCFVCNLDECRSSNSQIHVLLFQCTLVLWIFRVQNSALTEIIKLDHKIDQMDRDWKFKTRHSLIYTVVMFWKTWQKSNFAQIRSIYIYTHTYMVNCICIYQESSWNQNFSTHWSRTGRSMTTLPPMLLSSSILPPPLPYCTFILPRKNWGCV